MATARPTDATFVLEPAMIPQRWQLRWLVATALAASVPCCANALAHCTFHRSGETFAGGCGRLFDQTPAMKLAPEAAISTGVWRTDLHPATAWLGSMTDDGDTDPLELEIYSGGWGVLRTEYGWFPATHFTADTTAVTFELNPSREIRPNALDAAIIRRAAAILSADAVWNRADNRKCPATATTWSIYCAMEKATIEVTGGFNHRRPALEAVREIVDQRSAGRGYHHRLMDYNNDPTTRLSDAQSLFREALQGIPQSANQQP
jgi:hypothetical protein